MKNITYKQRIIINYIQKYLHKPKLKMKPVMRSIITLIQNNKKISLNQFNSIIKFIEREKEFKSQTRSQITKYFDEIIKNNEGKIINEYRTTNLEELFS